MGVGKAINYCFHKKNICKCCNKQDGMVSIDKEWENILQENMNNPDESEIEISLKI